MDFDAAETDTWTCTRCNRAFHIDGMGYIGPEDRDDTRCNPFMQFIYLCKECEDALGSDGAA
jgi:hypothetical protein